MASFSRFLILGFLAGFAVMLYRGGDLPFPKTFRELAERRMRQSSSPAASGEISAATSSPAKSGTNSAENDSVKSAAKGEARGRKKTAVPAIPKTAIQSIAPANATSTPAALPARPAMQPAGPVMSDGELYERLAPTVIQIFCRTNDQIASATGVIVTGSGLVLTNAHVAELVQKSGPPNCQARHGNPASPFANIEIVFVADTEKKIADTSVPQEDFAFLRLVSPSEGFRFAPVEIGIANIGEGLLTLGYPSEFLESINIVAHSNLVFSILSLAEYGDLDGNRQTAEAYVFRGGLVLQQGSSGTPLFNRSGRMVGIIFATTKAETTGDRNGVALTIPYIEYVLKKETSENLVEFLTSH